MSNYLLILLFFGLVLLLFIIGIPVGFSILITSVTIMLLGFGGGLDVSVVAGRLFRSMDKFVLLAIPFFIFASKAMNSGGMTERIFNFAKAVIGNLQGGLGHVNVLASMIFAGMSGTATGDAAGLGPIEYYSMTSSGYPKDFSIGITAASSVIGPIIPPSIPLTLYAIMSNTSVGGMLIAGFLPGIAIGIILMVICTIYAKKFNYPQGEKRSVTIILKSLKEGIFALGTPAILLISIFTGIVTVTEGAALAAFYTIFVVLFIYKEVSYKDLWKIFRESMVDSAIILFLLGVSGLYGYLILHAKIPIIIAEQLLNFTKNPYVFLLLMNLLLVVVGMFMETSSSIMILVPIFLPVAIELGISPIHFGVVMVFNLVCGVITPPYGQVLFVFSRVCNLDYLFVVKSLKGFALPLIFILLLITYWPALSTTLPTLLGLM